MISSGKDLKLALDSSGKSQAELARWLDLDPSIISKMVSGVREIKARELIKIKEFLDLADEETGSERPPSPPRFSDKIPIIGGAYGGAFDTVFFNRNTIQGYRPRPPLLDGVLDVFAVYVVGESMVPKFEPGALVYIDSNLPPAPFKYVVIDFGNNRAVIKQYLRLESDTFIVRQFNPPQDTPIPLCDVVRIYRITMSEEP